MILKRLLPLLFPLALFGSSFQVWNTDTIDVTIGRKTMLRGQTEFRYEKGGHKLRYKHYQGGIVFITSPQMLIQAAYRQTYHQVDKKWRPEYSPFIDLTFQAGSRIGWYVGDRNRFVYRVLGEHLGGKNRWLYRNRLEIIPPHRITKRKIAPFFADEFFWQEGRGIDQNRVELGFKIPYHQRTQLNLSYVWRMHKNRAKDWVNHNVVWVHFSLHF